MLTQIFGIIWKELRRHVNHPYFLQMLVWGVLSSLREGVHDLQGGGRGALQRCMGEKKHVCINFLKYFLRLEEKQKFHSC